MITPTTIIAAAAALIAIPSIAAPVNPPWPVVVGVLVAILADVLKVTSVVTVLDRVLGLHVTVENGDGSSVVSVPTDSADPPGSALFSFATATFVSTNQFGELNRLLLHARMMWLLFITCGLSSRRNVVLTLGCLR